MKNLEYVDYLGLRARGATDFQVGPDGAVYRATPGPDKEIYNLQTGRALSSRIEGNCHWGLGGSGYDFRIVIGVEPDGREVVASLGGCYEDVVLGYTSCPVVTLESYRAAEQEAAR
jgi:hypothetical protein